MLDRWSWIKRNIANRKVAVFVGLIYTIETPERAVCLLELVLEHSFTYFCYIKGVMVKLKEVGFINIMGKNLEYRWIDRKKNLTIVLLHEGLGSVSLWKNFPDELSEVANSNVFIYSRAGYGKSDPVALPRPLTYMHDEGLRIDLPPFSRTYS